MKVLYIGVCVRLFVSFNSQTTENSTEKHCCYDQRHSFTFKAILSFFITCLQHGQLMTKDALKPACSIFVPHLKSCTLRRLLKKCFLCIEQIV